ncbi:hypothetical protein [Paraburkholderia sp. A1RO-5L]|uniref:hypothetical protein n=1 Tax=Paraburkholderia sp. A1RO-5L TaxID=3028370 RepID=UPI003B772E66
MANESRVSDEDWRAARLRWESGEASVKQVADSIGVSKALVMKRKAAEGWQLRINVPPVPVGGAAQANFKVTESAGVSGRQAPPVTGHPSDTRASHAESAEAPERIDLGEIGLPANFAEMSFEERLAAAELAALARIDEMIARQERSSNAALSLLYSAMKASKDGDKAAFSRLRGAEVAHKALKLAHEEQRVQERQRVLRAYQVIEGVTPPKPVQPSILVVFSDDNSLTGPAGRRIRCGEGYTGALAAMRLASDRRAAAADVTDVEPIEPSEDPQ